MFTERTRCGCEALFGLTPMDRQIDPPFMRLALSGVGTMP